MITKADLNFLKYVLAPPMSCWEAGYGIRDYYILKLKDSIYITKYNRAVFLPKYDSFMFPEMCNDTLVYLCFNLGKRYDL